jgi:hypothetical protein
LEKHVLPKLVEPIRYSPELNAGLPQLIASVKSAGLEGLVAKRRNSRYEKCPRHPRYNPERDGAGAIRGGCRYCVAIYELYAGELAVEQSLQALDQQIARCAVFNTAVFRKEHA